MSREKTKARALAALLSLSCLLPSGARAFQAPAHEHLENFDRRLPAAAGRAVEPPHRAAAERLRSFVPDAAISLDLTVGAPLWVRSTRGFLTGPDGEGRAVLRPAARPRAVNDPARGVKAFLDEHRALFGHGSETLSAARVQRDFAAPGTGLRTTIWEQEHEGLPVFQGLFIAHVTRRGEVAGVSSRLHPDPARGTRGVANRPAVSAVEAVVHAAHGVEEPMTSELVTALDTPGAGDARLRQKFRAGTLPGEARAGLVWLPMGDGALRLCWEVFITRRPGGELYRVLIDAEGGQAWLRHGLTKNISDATYRVWTNDSPTPLSPGWPTPVATQPPVAPRALVTLSALNTNASPRGWINDGVNETLGNNVAAHLDQNGDDAPDLPRPQGSPSRVFDFPVNLAQTPTAYSDAAVVQLFYWCNWMHDRLYELGFTEAAGNFQTDNLGRGGLGGDAVLADAQDGGGFNNADFTTPPDGSAPRMQMYIFVPPVPDRDGSLDAEVILHEYTHGLTDRLVGGGGGLLNSQSGGLAEGWSDFYALSLLSEPTDDLAGTYPMGGYVSRLLGGLQENYYFGIRRYPYCTDLAKNPLTFKDIDPLQASSHPGVPRSPFGGGANEVHAQGEVWCSALWEARARLVQRLGWTNGNQLILQLVTDALPLTPANPDFLQARDAILQADLIRSGGANYRDLWTAFAKRGLGAGATSPGSSTTLGVVEAFNVPDDLIVLPWTGFIASGPVGGPFLPTGAVFTLTNLGTNTVIWSAMHPGDWLEVAPAAGTLPPGGATNFSVTLAPAANGLPVAVHSDTLTLSNAVSGFTQSRQFILRVGQPDFYTEQFSVNENDLAFRQLTFRPDGSPSFYAVCGQAATNFPTDPAGGMNAGLSDDSFRLVTLAGSNTIALYGRRTNVFFIGSNGYLTFDQGDQSNVKTLANYFSRPRVAGLLEDLDPGAGGSLTWRELSDRVAVTWENVPEWSTTNLNSLQMEMFHSGVIRLTWLRLNSRRGITGLSRGAGVPVAFVHSDLSSYGDCPPRPLLSIQVTDGAARLAWSGVPGTLYRVERKSSLDAMWLPLGTITLTNSLGEFLDQPATNAQRFYRVTVP